MSDAAPVSTRCVRAFLLRFTNIEPRVIDRLEMNTEVNADDRAVTTVYMPPGSPMDLALVVGNIWAALRKLPGAGYVEHAGVSGTATVEWDGICRPI